MKAKTKKKWKLEIGATRIVSWTRDPDDRLTKKHLVKRDETQKPNTRRFPKRMASLLQKEIGKYIVK